MDRLRAGEANANCLTLGARGASLEHDVVVERVFLRTHVELPIQQSHEARFQHVELLERKAADLGIKCVAVEAVLVELRGHSHAHEKQAVATERAHAEARMQLDEPVDVEEADDVALVASAEELVDAGEVRRDRHGRWSHGVEARHGLLRRGHRRHLRERRADPLHQLAACRDAVEADRDLLLRGLACALRCRGVRGRILLLAVSVLRLRQDSCGGALLLLLHPVALDDIVVARNAHLVCWTSWGLLLRKPAMTLLRTRRSRRESESING
mmetsp:Transcript_52329/g.154440  ORF Transcript_52329/g.154440 Transcript_52329/m.154440 type:complete len:270 (-) Transcript_52329:17-826(-)